MTNLGVSCRSNNVGGTVAVGNGSNYLNDFRIYDEALSPKQIKEISKGLVCHYKLDGSPSYNLIDKTKLTEGYYLGNNGVLQTSDWWAISDYIPVCRSRGRKASGGGRWRVLLCRERR